MTAGKLHLPKDTKVPNHVAIIPDGNRRWARSKGLRTLEGHRKGFDRAVEISRSARDFGIHTATLWGFSTENWDRTKEEVNYLMKLYCKLVDDYLSDAHKDKVKIVHLGRKDRLPKFLMDKIIQAQEETKDYTKYIANIAIDYGGQDDILRAIRKIIDEKVTSENINEKLFTSYTDLYDQPYPYVDLMIRTSGEQRTSGFLLWQSAYCEYYWENDHFPDFTPEKLREAVLDYSRRRRRFGGNDNEAHFKFKPEVVAGLELNWWRLRKIPDEIGFKNYTFNHLREQFGLSKTLAKDAAVYFIEALKNGERKDWKKATLHLKKFYFLIKEEIKLAFEPSIAASLEVKLWQDMNTKSDFEKSIDVEETAKKYYAEVYRISTFQAAKAAHLRVLATTERNMAENGMGEAHWEKASDYLQKFYSALKERIA